MAGVTAQFDPSTGAILKTGQSWGSRSFSCENSGPNVGIDSTRVIDLASQTLFVIVDAGAARAEVADVGGQSNSTSTARLHAMR